MINPKNKIENLLLSITKNCQTLKKQTHLKQQYVLEFKIIKPRKMFQYNKPVQIKGDWKLGLTSSEVYNSIFNKNHTNNKFELDNSRESKIGGISYEKVKNEVEKDLEASNITDAYLQDELIGQSNIKEYEQEVSKGMEDGVYLNILACYYSSIFQDFESYLTTEIGLVEDDIKLVFDKYNPDFLLMNLNHVFTILNIFPNLSLTFSNLNIQHLAT